MGRKVTLVPRAIAQPCAGGRGSPLLPVASAGGWHAESTQTHPASTGHGQASGFIVMLNSFTGKGWRRELNI